MTAQDMVSTAPPCCALRHKQCPGSRNDHPQASWMSVTRRPRYLGLLKSGAIQLWNVQLYRLAAALTALLLSLHGVTSGAGLRKKKRSLDLVLSWPRAHRCRSCAWQVLVA